MAIARLTTGISLTPDSLAYLYAARGLAAEGKLASIFSNTDAALTLFPPLYPALLAIGEFVLGSVELAAATGSVICIFLASFLTYRLFLQQELDPAFALLLTLGIFLHPKMQEVFWSAWSEGLYILLTLTILRLISGASRLNSLRTAVCVGALAGAGFLTRYAGVAILPAVAVGLMCIQNLSIAGRVRAAGTSLTIAVAVMVGWAVRNRFTDDSWLGQRHPSEDTLQFALDRLVLSVGEWVLPIGHSTTLHWAIGISALLLFAIVAITGWRSSPRSAIAVATPLAFATSHIALIITSQLTTAIDPIDTRLLSPAVVPSLLVAARLAKNLPRTSYRLPAGKAIAGMLFVFVAGWTLLSARWIGHPPWGLPPDTVRTEALPEPCRTGQWRVFSNRPDVLRYSEVAPTARLLPRQVPYRTTRRRDDWDEFESLLAKKNACLVWIATPAVPKPSRADLLGGPAKGLIVRTHGESNGVHVYTARAKDK